MSIFEQQFHLMETFFNQHNEPLIIANHGIIQAINSSACRMLNEIPKNLINQPVSKFVINHTSLTKQHVMPAEGESLQARIIMYSGCDDSHQLLLISPYMATGGILDQLAEVEDDAAHFRNMLTKIHEISLELTHADSLDNVYKLAVELAIGHLGFDRIGVLLFDEQTNGMIGSWGTDDDGNLKDEHDFSMPLQNAGNYDFIKQTLGEKYFVAVRDNVPLYTYGRQSGLGWNLMVGLWNGDDVIGWLAADNLVSGGPLKPYVRDIFGIYGQIVASSIVRKQYETELEHMNQNLEQLVQAKTAELNEKVEQLSKTQDELIDAEKLASLGSLVSGVAHEINTPVGISVTASSFMGEQIDIVEKKFANENLSKQDFQAFIKDAKEGVRIMNINLERASNLVRSFKQLAVDQHHDVLCTVHLRQIVENIIVSYRHEYKNRPITVRNEIPDELIFPSYPGLISQVFTNFFNNSLIYAFDSTYRVWGNGPSAASTKSKMPSTSASARSTSPPKSA